MFRRLETKQTSPVTIYVDGVQITANKGDTIAAALLASQSRSFRKTPVLGTDRGPFCMMGTCFDCLVTVDEEPNQQGCQILVQEGMRIERQDGAAHLEQVPNGNEKG